MAKVRELCGLIYSKFDTEVDLAHELGWNRQKLNRITNGSREPNLAEAAALAKTLGVSIERVANIFLCYKSPNKQQMAFRQEKGGE